MAEVTETLLFDIERHCNNYFNPHNISNSPERIYPASFLELAGRIAIYIEESSKTNKSSEAVGEYSVHTDLEYSSWQKAFARELSIFKRARFM